MIQRFNIDDLFVFQLINTCSSFRDEENKIMLLQLKRRDDHTYSRKRNYLQLTLDSEIDSEENEINS